MSINADVMKRFVEGATERVQGNWVIIGGSLLHLLKTSSRQTEDIDLAGPAESTNADTLALMTLAELINLPIEAINPAGSYFLHKIPNWSEKLILVHRGSMGAIYRPNLQLFFELKLARLTEADLIDCISYLKFSVLNCEDFDPETLVRLCETSITSPEKQKYKSQLLNAIRSL